MRGGTTVSTIFIAVALVTAAVAIVTVVAALLVLAGFIIVQEVDREDDDPPPVDPRSTLPTLQFQSLPPAHRAAPSTAPLRAPPLDTVPPDLRVGRDEVPAYADGDVAHERRPTEMFETNAGNFSGLGIDDNDERL